MYPNLYVDEKRAAGRESDKQQKRLFGGNKLRPKWQAEPFFSSICSSGTMGIFEVFEPSCPRRGAKVPSGGSIESSGGVCALYKSGESNEVVKGRVLCLGEGGVE
jgi:hypothetical protein